MIRRLIPNSWLSAGRWAVFELPLRELANQPQPNLPIRWASTADAELLSQMGWPITRVRQLLDSGARTALLERGGRLLACLLLESYVHEPYEWLRFELPPQDLWVVYTWVHPDARGAGLFGHLRRFVATDCMAQGYGRILNAIGEENVKSLQANAKLPTRRLGRIVYLRVPGLTLVSAAGQVHLGRWNKQRPLALDMARFGGSF